MTLRVTVQSLSFFNDWAVLPSLVILQSVRTLTHVGQIEQHAHERPLVFCSLDVSHGGDLGDLGARG